ncbi:MAG TPA: thiamine diphosphokinase [Anaerolineales bacterium]|nr:thiamine diphosphokinase [Anaerolineales bacterium]
MSRIIIFANGELPNIEKTRVLIQADDYIVCADGGTRHALALGLRPNLIVGDLDSLEEADLQKAGTRVVQYPRNKDETDLELALNQALEREPASVCVIAALGNRVDQTIGNISLLSDPRLAKLNIRFDDGVEEVFFCRDHSKVEGRRTDIVSLIPWNGAVKGVRTKGLRWQLNDETLYPEKTRGISNEMTDPAAEVSLESGLLLIIHRRL